MISDNIVETKWQEQYDKLIDELSILKILDRAFEAGQDCLADEIGGHLATEARLKFEKLWRDNLLDIRDKEEEIQLHINREEEDNTPQE
jgi:hypothetical protein